MDKPEGRGIGRTLLIMLLVVVVLGLGGVVLYLLSQLNYGRYQVNVTAGSLVIERGRMFPFGSRPFEPESEDLRRAYAPIPVPAGVTVGRLETFADRADIDRALFGLMANWARERLEAKEPEAFVAANEYVQRCELLPGLSEDQRRELKALRADLAFRRGRRLLNDVATQLRQALSEFNVAKQLGTSRRNEVDAWIVEVQQQIQAYEETMRTPPRRLVDSEEELVVPPLPGPVPPPAEAGDTPEAPPSRWRL